MFEPIVEVNLIEVRSYKFLAQLMSLGAQEWNLEPCEGGDQRLRYLIGVRAGMSVGRLDLTQRCRDDEQPMRVSGHEPQPMNKYASLSGERVHQIRQVFPFHHADVFQACNCIVAQPEGLPLDGGKPDPQNEKNSNGFCSRVSTSSVGRGVLVECRRVRPAPESPVAAQAPRSSAIPAGR